MDRVRVLIVEDDALVVLLLAELLQDMGHEVCGIAATEAEAAACVLYDRPELMIVDGKLAAGSGVSLVEETCHGAKPIAHFFLSGDPEMIHLRIPGSLVVGKPFRRVELTNAIEAALALIAS
jgi:two-component system, response regulator PdtaR